MIMLRTVE